MIGGIFLGHPEPDRFTEQHEAIAAGIAKQAALAFEKARLYEASRKAEAELRRREEQLRLATEAGEIGLWDFDLVTGDLFWQPRVKTMFGISPDAPVTRADFDSGLHPDDRDRVLACYEAATDPEQRAAYDVEYRVVGKEDGVVRWIASKGRGIFDDSGRCLRIIGTAMDVTARRLAEERLARSERAYRELNATLERRVAERTAERDRLWRNSQDLHIVVSSDGVLQAVSPAVERTLGWSPEEMIGRPVFDFVIDEDLEGTREAVRYASSQPRPAYENRYKHKDGGYRWISWVAAPEGGFIYGSGRDITAEKRNAEALAKAEEALRQAQKIEAIGRLTGGIAHDFNNVMQSVAGTLELICARPDAHDQVRRWAEVGLRAAERGSRLTGQLLAFSRMQKLEAKPLLLSDVVYGMRELLGRTLGPAIRIRFDLLADGVRVLADEVQLEMALLNLAINARDAMPDGGDLRIATRLARVREDPDLQPGDYVELSVADTGIGMSAEVASRAFDPFFTTKGVGKGTGLGLSQVYGMMRQVGGAAHIESEPGRGTVLRLFLQVTDAPVASASRASAPRWGDARLATVLIVDDDPDVRCFMSDALRSLGYSPVEAEDGNSGIAALERERPDVLILDYAMPGMTGAEVAREARVRGHDLPIVFSTGFAETAAIETVLGRNAPVLRKPFRIRELQEVLDTVLSGRFRS